MEALLGAQCGGQTHAAFLVRSLRVDLSCSRQCAAVERHTLTSAPVPPPVVCAWQRPTEPDGHGGDASPVAYLCPLSLG